MTNDLEEDPLLNEVRQLLRETNGLKMDAKVSDFMRPNPMVLKDSAKLKDAIRVIIENKIDGVPIVNDRGGIVGLMTKTLALREINQSGDVFKPIQEIMKANPLVTAPNKDISTLIAANVGSLPVVDEDRVVGIVTLSDTIRAYFRSVLNFKKLKEDLVTIIESSFDGIYLTDNQGRILQVNEAFARITGIEKEELLHFSMEELVARGVFKQAIPLQTMQEGKPVTISQEVRTGKTILVTSSPILDANGQVFRVVHNARDITELNNLKNQLEMAESLTDHYKAELNKIKIANKYLAKSKKSKELIELVLRLSKVDTTVLILGESGVGKEIIAEMLHENSIRREKLMIPINCAAIPEHLLESELFGYEPGAFTGAHKRGRAGIFELANGGTIFLDEIGEMPLHLQSKLLRTIQQQVITRLGGHKSLKVDVRMIAASNKNLAEMVTKNEFRKDLFYRLNVVPVMIPPLRDRREEIPDFVAYFTHLFNKKYKINKRFDEQAIDHLMSYDWPGNVRELQNVIERNMITCPEDIIHDLDFIGYKTEDALKRGGSTEVALPVKLRSAVADLEKDILQSALVRCGTTRKAATEIGLSQPTFIRKALKYKIKLGRTASGARHDS